MSGGAYSRAPRTPARRSAASMGSSQPRPGCINSKSSLGTSPTSSPPASRCSARGRALPARNRCGPRVVREHYAVANLVPPDRRCPLGDTEPVVLVDIEDRIATVTLNRPQERNALSRAVTYGLWDAVAAAGGDPGVSVGLLTGADPASWPGAGLHEP